MCRFLPAFGHPWVCLPRFLHRYSQRFFRIEPLSFAIGPTLPIRGATVRVGPFGANSGSVLAAQLRVWRRRTFSPSNIRRTWLRPTVMPASRAAWARVSRVHCVGTRSSSADSFPAPSRGQPPGRL